MSPDGMSGGLMRRARALATRLRAPRVALVACARDEAALLPAFLLYHRAIGVERVYLFLDRCTDASAAEASRFRWVTTLHLDPAEAAALPYVSDIHAACMNRALQLARADGIDWLLVLDPDEFACAGNPGDSAIARAHLPSLLRRVKPQTAMVRLRTHELVPVALPVGTPIWKQRHFQTEPRLAWRICDPLTGAVHAWNDFLGHRQGKYLVRTSLAVQAYDSHRWVPEQVRRFPDRPQFVALPTEDLGWHWHFFVTDQRHWREKFRKQAFQPLLLFCGSTIELPKQVWRRAAAEGSADDVGDYFERWIARPAAELHALVASGDVVESDGVEAVLREAGHLDGDALKMPEAPARPASARRFRPSADRGPALAVDALGRILDYPAALTPDERLHGAHALEAYEGRPFRWLAPEAGLRLRVTRGAYRLRLRMEGLASLWAGQLALAMNGRAIAARELRIEAGTVSLLLLPEDFDAGSEHWLEMRFTPVVSATPDPRALGAPFFGLGLEALSAPYV